MARTFASIGIAALVIGAAALGAASLSGPAAAYEGRWDRQQERPAHGWRPSPPIVHGYWGARYWRRYGDAERRHARPDHYQGYGYGWR
jgi:hypothetical protein